MLAVFRFLVLLIPFDLIFCQIFPLKEIKGEILRQTRGVWIASVYNLDWPSKPDLSEKASFQEITHALDELVELGFNTIYLQVKPAWGVLYDSKLEPVSGFLVSEGKTLSYDPINFWINEAHKRGLFIHAWINPFRIVGSKNPYPNKEIWVKLLADTSLSWLDPCYPQVINQLMGTLNELMNVYAFDGLHLDDYFYPYPDYLKGKDFNDKKEFESYKEKGGALTKDEWRRNNIDRFVESLSNWMHTNYPSRALGISPFGIWQESELYDIKGTESYSDLYANSLSWINNGWIDYIVPQLYWSTDMPNQDFRQLLAWWINHMKRERILLVGVLPEPIGSQKTMKEEEVVLQERLAREKTEGIVFFRLKTVLENKKTKNLLKKIFNQPALPSPILSRPVPTRPLVFIKGTTLYPMNQDPSSRIWIKYKKGSSVTNLIAPYAEELKLPRPPKTGEVLEVVYINESGNTGLPLFIRF